MLGELHTALQSVESSLRQNKAGYDIQRVVCMSCGRVHPMKKWHPCNNAVLHQKHCTSDTRLAEYFAILAQVLWPSITPFNLYSVLDFITRFDCTMSDLRHSCAAGSRCPLETGLRDLSCKVHRIKETLDLAMGPHGS